MDAIKFRYVLKNPDGVIVYHFCELAGMEKYGLPLLADPRGVYTVIARNLFTGLQDGKGRDIYEGDILGGIWAMGYIDWCDQCKSFEYFFDSEVFPKYCNACNGDCTWAEVVEDHGLVSLEVVGSIYSNPELLKGRQP